jgi:hypothetical protein
MNVLYVDGDIIFKKMTKKKNDGNYVLCAMMHFPIIFHQQTKS